MDQYYGICATLILYSSSQILFLIPEKRKKVDEKGIRKHFNLAFRWRPIRTDPVVGLLPEAEEPTGADQAAARRLLQRR